MRQKLHGKDLTREEKNLFSSAYKNIIVTKRKQWRSIIEIMEAEEKKAGDDEGTGDGIKFKCINEMKEDIEDEIRAMCKELYIEAKYFLRTAISTESKVFYQKIKADTLRYLAQFESGKNATKVMNETEQRYKEAMEEALALEATHPLRLALSLNYATFKYEIEQNFSGAIDIAALAFQEAQTLLPSLEALDRDETLRVMILLEDNIDLWKLDEEHQRKKAEHLEFSIKNA